MAFDIFHEVMEERHSNGVAVISSIFTKYGVNLPNSAWPVKKGAIPQKPGFALKLHITVLHLVPHSNGVVCQKRSEPVAATIILLAICSRFRHHELS